MAELNALRTEIGYRKREIDRPIDRILTHRGLRLAGKAGECTENASGDSLLAARALKLFKTSAPQTGNSIWLNEFAKEKRADIKKLMAGDVADIDEMLRDPASNMLMYGFDNITSHDVPKNREAWWREWMHILAYDSLLRLAKAIGILRVENPEPGIYPDEAPDPDTFLEDLDDALGFRVHFPNLYQGEIGLQTSRGVASYRAVQALYQAWRIKTLAPNGRICEIGDGLGRTAYYSTKAGAKSYCIVDLPLTGISQTYFLGRLTGELSVHGEPVKQIHLMPPEGYGGEYDLIVNFDSLTEMDRAVAASYLDKADAPFFLSINHEANAFTVRELVAGKKVHRSPCWVREGYVEELIWR